MILHVALLLVRQFTYIGIKYDAIEKTFGSHQVSFISDFFCCEFLDHAVTPKKWESGITNKTTPTVIQQHQLSRVNRRCSLYQLQNHVLFPQLHLQPTYKESRFQEHKHRPEGD